MSVDPTSPTWGAVKKHVETKIGESRDRLELATAHDVTQFERGRVAAMREILALGTPTPPIVGDAPTY
ncbi:hypothetical protein DYI37_03860 [Fulvimarina endophytica]|uniref:Uncharacterized protein n=1 Tax=Fulvimarina endophytica TaxID=2293836 RepID=A0A371X748_9HYPH|nr:hypothetical protein [Fulvimarina endophytica]RFC65011.1 hypothetical protein DYI37_03860 [Fulvimarina endophytica]